MIPSMPIAGAAVVVLCAVLAEPALAAEPVPMSRAEERAYRADLDEERDRLERELSRVTERAGFAAAIEAQGYRLASVNVDQPDYVEFEIVKDRASHEVRIKFDPESKKVRDLDVDRNMWLSETTERMLEDPAYVPAAPLVPAPDGGSSDRSRIDSWEDEKDRLETLLEGRELSAIVSELEQSGYQITSTNDREPNYVEYEIAKGDNTYEVQVEVDAESRRAREVDVTTNLWRARSTREAQREGK